MNIIKKITQSRFILKEYLKEEWDVSTIQDYSENEISKMYSTKKDAEITFGEASGCNFSVNHKELHWHKLHIIYYNFPEIGKSSVKITKDCAKKINKLYETILEPDDSVIVIITESITENLLIAFEDLYKNGQEYLSTQYELENDLKDYELRHVRNVHLFQLDHLTKDIRKNIYVPKHESIRKSSDIQQILSDTNSNQTQLPSIKRTDIQAKILRLAPGDICKIIRKTETGGEIPYFRICK